MNTLLNNQPAHDAGFSLLAKQKPPFSKIVAGDLETRLANYYDDGSAIGGLVFPAISEADRNRLVESSKCPTPDKSSISAQSRRIDEMLAGWGVVKKKPNTSRAWEWDQWLEAETRRVHAENPVKLAEELAKLEKQRKNRFQVVSEDRDERRNEGPEVGAWAVVSRRKWSGQYRIRTQVDQPSGLPPEQAGLRVSTSLSESGARKLADSCNFMNVQNGGFKTFMTLTMDIAGRRRVEDLKASGDFTELDTAKLSKGVVVAIGMIKPKGEKLNGLKVADVWIKKRDDVFNWSADNDYCPVEVVAGRYVAAATGEEFDDVTFTTIQKELGRFFDGANKMRQRGWKADRLDKFKNPVEIRGKVSQVREKPSKVISIEGFLADKKIKYKRLGVRYAWVVENPLNKEGQRNPHIHILIDWRVGYTKFFAWADRLEKLWGQGMANMEKIEDSKCAGAYLAKAAGYITKAQGESDQGPVRGNRYGISKDARATDWACIGRYPMHVMGHLIKDVHDYYTHSYGALSEGRRQLSNRAAEIRKEIKTADKTELSALYKRRANVAKRLNAARDTLDGVPIIPSKYQLIINTEEAFDTFIDWAMSPESRESTAWLPEKSADEQWRPWEERPKGLWLKTYQMVLHAKKAARRWAGIDKFYKQWTDSELVSSAVCYMSEWREFQQMRWAA